MTRTAKGFMAWWVATLLFGAYALWAFLFGTPGQWLVACNLLTLVQWLQILSFIWLTTWLSRGRKMYEVKALEAEQAREQYLTWCRRPEPPEGR